MGDLITFPTKGRPPTAVVRHARETRDKTQALRRMAALSASAERCRAALATIEKQMHLPENLGNDDLENDYHEADFAYSTACVTLFEHLRTMQRQNVLDTDMF